MPTRAEKKKPSTTKRMIIMLVIVGLLLAGLIGFNVFKGIMIKKYMASMSAPPQTVTAMKVTYQEWQPSLETVGTLRAVQGADLALDASGVIDDIRFKSGALVQKGQPLVGLRDDEDVAKLKQNEAAAALAQVTFERAKQQLAVKAVSKAEYDTAAADLKARQAAVAEQQAVVAKKNLKAPFDGLAGIVTLSPGAYLTAGTPVVTLQQLDPIYIDFHLPQKQLAEVGPGDTASLALDAFGDRHFTGTINAVDPKLDPDTRNALVEATVPNPDHLLKPGMFAHVSVDVGKKQRHLTLPQTAITFNPYGQTVFVAVPASQLKDSNGKPVATTPAKGKDKSANTLVAQQVFVTTGATRGDQTAVLSGIKEGDQVVTSGQIKLKNGTPLIIDNSVKPANNPHPTPQEH
jgi:membrane fusion protein (multidrug efflux system)